MEFADIWSALGGAAIESDPGERAKMALMQSDPTDHPTAFMVRVMLRTLSVVAHDMTLDPWTMVREVVVGSDGENVPPIANLAPEVTDPDDILVERLIELHGEATKSARVPWILSTPSDRELRNIWRACWVGFGIATLDLLVAGIWGVNILPQPVALVFLIGAIGLGISTAGVTWSK